MSKDKKTRPYEDTEFTVPAEVLPIVAATAKERSRYATNAVLVTRTNGAYTAVATDGRRLLAMDWQTKEKGKGEVYIHRDAFKGSQPLTVTEEKKTVRVQQRGKPLQRFDKPEDAFFPPHWKDVIPNKSENTLEISVNPRLLGDLLLAIAKAQRNSYPIQVSFFLNPTDPKAAILLEAKTEQTTMTGIVMPCNRM